MKILYGTSETKIDITEICMTQLLKNNIITIPDGDVIRARYFSDPSFGTVKRVFVQKDNEETFQSINDTYSILINITDNTVNLVNIDEKLREIHSHLTLNHGSFNDEYPEQKMTTTYLTGNEKVLEIGGNIGRNSLVIAHILGENNNNLVVLESDPDIAAQLQENRDLNNFNFHIENSALSKRKLIQSEWTTMESDTLLDGYKWINTITLDELNAKYNIAFDTLVLDCEGAFYFILMDMSDILTNINLIIMKNDYEDIRQKEYIDDVLRANNFILVYVEGGGWGPCQDNFFEVWKRV
jgi:FkbM family methyltransferase